MLTVLSPAKTLDYQSPWDCASSQPAFLDQSEQLIGQLRSLSPQDICGLMKISDALGLLNFDRFQQWSRPFTRSNAKPALLAFKGDVYTGLQADAFDADDLAFAQQHLRVLSGLYGVLRPLDLMQPYRLEMGTRLANHRGRDLYRFWGDQLALALNAQAEATGATCLVNLASNEYFRAVAQKKLTLPVINPVFEDEKNGNYKVISFFAKKARGMMARFIVKQRLTRPEQLKAFNDAGYHFVAGRSDAEKWVFRRSESQAAQN